MLAIPAKVSNVPDQGDGTVESENPCCHGYDFSHHIAFMILIC